MTLTKLNTSFSLFGIIFAILLVSCTPSTRITGTWKKPDAAIKHKILLAAMTHSTVAKTTVEGYMADEFRKNGIDVTEASMLFAPNFHPDLQKDKEMLLKTIRENGNDAVLMMTLIDHTEDTRYVPGTATYSPMSYGYYGGFYSYYNYMYPTVYQPGYYTEDQTYYLETNLYDIETEDLLWSAQSQAVNPSSLGKFAIQFAKITVDRLQSEGLVKS